MEFDLTTNIYLFIRNVLRVEIVGKLRKHAFYFIFLIRK